MVRLRRLAIPEVRTHVALGLLGIAVVVSDRWTPGSGE